MNFIPNSISWHGAGWRLLYCALGAAAGLSMALLVVTRSFAASPLFLASLGGSTVFLFGLTRAPAVQPRALLCGHLGAAAIGIACYQYFGGALWVYALSAVLAMLFMLVTRTVHPPAGANALIMIHLHAGWWALVTPVLLGVLSLALVAMLWSRCYPGLTHWPVDWRAVSPPTMTWGGWE